MKLEQEGCSTRIIVHPTAGGKLRGSHNCGQCDAEVVAAIERYAVSASLAEFSGIECTCQKQWKLELELERNLPVPLGLSKHRRTPSRIKLRSP